MEKNINIINSKENTIELDIEIDGLKPSDKKCFFVIKTTEVNFSFECKNSSGNKWEVVIPRMPQIKDTLYNFYIYMVVDGYYFEPYSGTLNVMKSNDVYVKDISNKTFEPTKQKSEDKPKEEPIISSGKIKKEYYTPKKVEHKTSSITELAKSIFDKDKPLSEEAKLKELKVKEILGESNIVTKNKSKIKKGNVTEI